MLYMKTIILYMSTIFLQKSYIRNLQQAFRFMLQHVKRVEAIITITTEKAQSTERKKNILENCGYNGLPCNHEQQAIQRIVASLNRSQDGSLLLEPYHQGTLEI